MEPTPVMLADIQVVYYIKLSFLTLLVYDTLLQLHEEYLHVWKSRWTLIKCLYLWTRYSTFVGVIVPLVHAAYAGPLTCGGVVTFTTIFSGFGIGITEMILMVRTYTLYERSKKLLAFFFVLWFVIRLWNIILGCYEMDRFEFFLYTFPVDGRQLADLHCAASASSCYFTSSSRISIGLVCYFALLCGETIIVLLTMWKVLLVPGQVGLLRSMYFDGVWFYLAILPFTIATVVCLFFAPVGLSELFATPVQVMHSILCCRLITHARNVAAEEDKREEAINRVFKSSYMLSDTVVDITPYNKV
ncbi:hypothetical protein MSAN_01417900 [Mycena sanguinolenta]|uniref:DUF6533 domain-containing protein n=1 Tax=Mycena sanguinolenta TaxID=230812 RepID=A0A8H6YAY4_9AGAR|nr:hypothetical protein MSAN_01417900 [Mycena sanguinolenta]